MKSRFIVPTTTKNAESASLGVSPSEAPFQESRCVIFCIASIWSTPKNAGNHAQQIRRVVDNCIKHKNIDDSGKEEE